MIGNVHVSPVNTLGEQVDFVSLPCQVGVHLVRLNNGMRDAPGVVGVNVQHNKKLGENCVLSPSAKR